jgi:hypothetical protein
MSNPTTPPAGRFSLKTITKSAGYTAFTSALLAITLG